MAIYFKFKSEKSYDSIPLNDPFISVPSFKQKVYELRYKGKKNAGLCVGNDFDITVINAQTNDPYDDKMLIANHTNVLIQRVPGGRRCRFVNTTTIVVPGSHVPKSSASNSNSSSSNSVSASASTCTSTSISTSSYGSDGGDSFAKNVEVETAVNFPDELVCSLCKQPMKDAMFASLIRSMLESGFTIPQPQKSASTSASILAIHPQTSAGGCDRERVAQPQTSSADVPIQPQTPISASKSSSILVAVEEEVVQQKEVVNEIGNKKRKRENPENVEATDCYLMCTGFDHYNSVGMNFTDNMPTASLGVQ
ncbi:DWNN domain a CCHC-type zinc finger [Euphorbia peplus]|nr:DWNN domain a CCHC-type zinc finger [Euphorbia peplus]